MMLNEQAIDGDVITIHNKTVRTDIAAPAHPVAVISAPDPGVIDDRVVAVYRQVSRCSAHPGAPYSGKNIIERDGVFCVTGFASALSHLEQNKRFLGSCVEQQTGDDNPVHVSGRHGRSAIDGTQCSEAKPHYYRVGPLSPDSVV